MAKNNFLNNLDPSGLSENHNKLPKNIKLIEKKTRLRRASPLYPSKVLGDLYKYGEYQFQRKVPLIYLTLELLLKGKPLNKWLLNIKML